MWGHYKLPLYKVKTELTLYCGVCNMKNFMSNYTKTRNNMFSIRQQTHGYTLIINHTPKSDCN